VKFSPSYLYNDLFFSPTSAGESQHEEEGEKGVIKSSLPKLSKPELLYAISRWDRETSEAQRGRRGKGGKEKGDSSLLSIP